MAVVDRRDGVVDDLGIKRPCRLVATSNVSSLSGLQTIDGNTLAAADRVLLTAQTTGSQNGIWVASTGNWTRPKDFDGSYDAVKGTQFFVTDGTTYSRTTWNITTSGTIVIDSTSLTIIQTVQAAGGALTNTRLAKTAAYTVTNADKGVTLALGGTAFYTVTINAASGYDANFEILIINEDATRGKRISPNGVTSFILWPKQTVRLLNSNSVWFVDPPQQRWRLPSVVTFYVDPVNGNNNNDGLATGTGAVLTIQQAVNYVIQNLDIAIAGPTIQLADGTYTAGASITGPPIGSTTWGTIQGNSGTPSNVLINVPAGTTAFDVQDHCGIGLRDMKIQSSGAGSVGINGRQFVIIDTNNIEFGAMASGIHVDVTDNSVLSYGTTATISGDASIHIRATHNSLINFSGTINIASARAFSVFAAASGNSSINTTASFAGAGVAGTTGIRTSSQTAYITNASTYPGSTAASGTDAATADGTAANPWFSWQADADTGLYRAGANNPAMSANGAKVQGWSTTGTDITGLLDISAAASGQVKFPASQNASSNVNTLDDYEEGTWTPVLTFLTPGNLSVSYTAQVGSYTKIGNLVRASVHIVTSAFTHTTASGQCFITGLPFTSANVTNNDHECAGLWQGITKANYTDVAGSILSNTSQIGIMASGSAQTFTTVSAADMPSGGQITFKMTAVYQTVT